MQIISIFCYIFNFGTQNQHFSVVNITDNVYKKNQRKCIRAFYNLFTEQFQHIMSYCSRIVNNLFKNKYEYHIDLKAALSFMMTKADSTHNSMCIALHAARGARIQNSGVVIITRDVYSTRYNYTCEYNDKFSNHKEAAPVGSQSISMNINRHSLIFGLSYALDVAGKYKTSHSKSTAYLSVMLGRRIGLCETAIMDIYYAALLHDIGLSDSKEIVTHCVNGEKMLSKLPLSKGIARCVYYHHEYYNGSGVFKLSGDDIPLCSQIICFSSAFDDVFGEVTGDYNRNLYLDVCRWLEENKIMFSDKIVSAFEDLIKHEFFLLDYFDQETKYTLSQKIIVDDSVYYKYDDVVKYARCFADIIDRKSPFTFTHSQGIAQLARTAAKHLGYDIETQDKMYIAGLLHDIGKLYVSTDILHKNGKLTPDERFEINKHTYYTRRILEQIQGFEDIVGMASNHHEKIDGTGYPRRIPGDQLSELEKVMAICDVYQALTEARPYRESLSIKKVWEIINDMALNQHLDKQLVAKVHRIFTSKLPPEDNIGYIDDYSIDSKAQPA